VAHVSLFDALPVSEQSIKALMEMRVTTFNLTLFATWKHSCFFTKHLGEIPRGLSYLHMK